MPSGKCSLQLRGLELILERFRFYHPLFPLRSFARRSGSEKESKKKEEQEMGISGLLPVLKSVTEQVPLSRFKGKLIAVDGNVWIHRGTYACAMELAEGTPTIAYVRFCQKMAELITSLGVRLLIVFDGRSLPAKGPAHQRRREKRRQANQALSAFAELSKEQALSMAPNRSPDPYSHP